jgi:hypothetical protein
MSRKYYRSAGSGSRWMPLRYPGTCKVCGDPIAAGDTAYWDAASKTTTCFKLDCCEADGLAERTGHWAGNHDGVLTLRERRVGSGAPSVIVTRFNSGAATYRNARGRCIDAPCCGCCD